MPSTSTPLPPVGHAAADEHLPARERRPAPVGRPAGERLAALLVGRRSAWAVLGVFVVLLLAVMGGMRGGGPVAGMDALPESSESSRAAAIADTLEGSRFQPVFAVITRTDGGALTDADAAGIETLRPALQTTSGREVIGPMPAADGEADLLVTTVDAQADTEAIDAMIADLRETAQDSVPEGLTVSITGGPAVGSDIRGAFAGADFRLLAVTIAVVAVLLLLTYRSPILWLLPLTVVALADGAAGRVTDTLGEQFSLAFDAGVISVLVFGAGTNYALLLISRYREELHRTEDHRAALALAWRRTVPAILASNITVVLALLTLLAAVMPATRGLGLAAAAGLLIALVAVLFPLTSLLSVCGRRGFWPFVPRPGATTGHRDGAGHRDDAERRDGAEHGPFAAVARAVTGRPWIAAVGSMLLLAVLATGLLGTRVGLSQDEQFAAANESSTGFATMAEHYGAGESAPHRIVVREDAAEAAIAAAESVPGIERVATTGTTADGWAVLSAVGSAEPESPAASDEVEGLRDALHALSGADALVSGTSANAVDVRADSARDLLVVGPLILLVVLAVLILLLRAVVAPLVLLAVNVLSAVAAIGLGLFAGRTLLGIPALDVTVPLLAFLFLVALGVDYTIFLVHRARHEAATHGTAHGMIRAVGSTGVVITSAGVVLAAAFAALGVLPLVVLGQLGLIVGLGVLLDTLLVRTVLVPALFALIGERMWWPTAPTEQLGTSSEGATEPVPARA
ncbi:MMPL family transporter [Brachybacterium sp. J144]|uniref:MMPL family transporter n=1 Tax=Brachybacterium sp. J144 TaxID=3116487 RepID=UPI002E777869|nr:MMPL family transporter [Brachybacterium sp. J144]MEE1650152.1 MMPL family transporter [Brachybacterium sp. J144]